MSSLLVDVSENQHLSEVLAVIEQRMEALKNERTKGSEDLATYRKYMWEDAALFDRAEQVQSENLALTQEHAVLDVSVQMKRLNILASSPYFGRIDFQEDGLTNTLEIYIGLHGLFDDQHNLIIYDWRAPVSSMFYDYEVGPAEYVAPEGTISGKLRLKRQYKIENGRMLYLLDSNLTINDEILRDALAQNTSEKMKQIVNSIQKEQNDIIRSEKAKVILVQGPAGSGKTSIAMHRAAYLLYRHRDHLNANNLLIFSPNEVFADYISNVLPELGEENIREATFDDYARSILGARLPFESRAHQMEFILSGERNTAYAQRTASIAFKSSYTFLRILRNYARHLRHSNLRFNDIKLNDRVVMAGKIVQRLYWEYCSELPIKAGIERLKDRVLARLTYSGPKDEKKIERQVDKVIANRDAAALYRNLFRDPELVHQLAEGEPLPEYFRSICKFTFKSLHEPRALYEDVAPILLLQRLIDGEPRYANVRHLIIDEAQDYTPVHFDIIKNLFGESSMTILGDFSQQINTYSGIDSYDPLTSIFARDTQNIVKLTRSYRSSWEISEFARGILPDAMSVDNVRRNGRRPKIVRADSKEEHIRRISEELIELEAEGMKSAAVICKSAKEAMQIYTKLTADHDIHLIESDSIKFHHGLVVLPIYLAKGLEFDAVIIYDAGSVSYNIEPERKLLYTACTRALHSLTLYYSGEPSPLLPMEKRDLFEV